MNRTARQLATLTSEEKLNCIGFNFTRKDWHRTETFRDNYCNRDFTYLIPADPIKLLRNDRLTFSNSFMEELKHMEGKAAKLLLWIAAHPYSHYAEKTKREIGNFLSVREKEGTISFLPKGKTLEYNGKKWARKNRQDIKPGKLIRQIFPKELLSDQEVKIFVDQFVNIDQPFTFRERSGADAINDVYDSSISSCEKGSPVGEFYHAAGCTILEISDRKTNETEGRAIIWHGVNIHGTDQKVTMIDRTYPASSTAIHNAVKTWAKEKGYYLRADLCAGDNKEFITPEGETEEVNFWIEQPDTDEYEYHPYLDTLLRDEYGYLKNFYGRVKIEYVTCVNGQVIDKDEAVTIRGKDGYYHPDEVCETHGYGKMLKSDCLQVEYSRYYYLIVPRERITEII